MWPHQWISFFFFQFVFDFMGLHCCARAFTSCSEQGLLFVAAHGLLLLRAQALGAWASVAAALRLSSPDSWALVAPQHVDSSWTSDRTSDRTSDAELADRFLTTGPPGKSHTSLAS